MRKSSVLIFMGTWWCPGLAILIAILAQIVLSANRVWPGLGLYVISVGLWLSNKSIYSLRSDRTDESVGAIQSRKFSRLQKGLLNLSIFATYVNIGVTLGYERFTWIGVIAWGVSICAFMAAFWQKRAGMKVVGYRLTSSGIHLTWHGLACIVIILLGVFFRMWRLQEVPPEMTLDHTQNLLDIRDIVEGGVRPLFFNRNTGREPLLFYWTAFLVWLTQHPIDFTILKVGTVLPSFLTLPGVYLLARELYGRLTGLWAMGFAAVASWLVILNRTGLRLSFAPMFSAWAFYYLVRGLKRGERASFLLLGLCLGMGLYSYTAFRIVPFAVAYIWFALNIVERSGMLRAKLNWRNFGLVVITAMLVFIPLGVFALNHAEAFWGRSAWYLDKTTNPGPLTFLNNVKNVLLMFNWRGDSMPLTTLPYKPVLDPILGGLLVLGVVTAVKRVLNKADSFTFVLVLLGLFSLFPSALAINFPNENPSVVRAGCAIPVVVTLAALPIGTWLENLSLSPQTKKTKIVICAALASLMFLLIRLNVDRIFVRYPQAYRTLAFNTSEIADAIRCFDTLIGDTTDAYIVAGPGWINDDALAFELGLPVWENRLEEAELADRNTTTPKMYILHAGNTADLRTLQALFPMGVTQTYTSRYNQDFKLFIVPGGNVRSMSLTDQAVQLTTCASQ
ncbi:MAG: glycosyltransferase family 39 protein [Anaerolineae bacterium]|nr:glycosyltransferase family 39 protein [Anaerolineae bacterium]